MLGSGLGDYAGTLQEAVALKYEDIPHWPSASVIGHAGKLVAGRAAGGRAIFALAGRAHFYEGYDLRTVTFNTRVLGLLGVKVLIITNAAGGINTSFAQGALMLISDHINLLGSNPLIGPNEPRFGERFPDMTEVYSKRLRALAGKRKRAPASGWRKASTSRSTARATKRPRKFASCGRLAPTRWGCRRCRKRSSRGTWDWKCSASRASRTWPRACCRSRSITRK